MSSLMSSFQQYLSAAAIILLPNIGGGICSYIFRDGIKNWSRTLKRSSLNPPSWVFGPVWTSIYLCMGVSSYLIFREGGFEAQSFPLAVYGVQFAFNMMWSPLFFGLHRINLAFFDIVALWFSIAATIYVFNPINRTAALLLLPHFFWISFASFLNLNSWRINGARGEKALKAN